MEGDRRRQAAAPQAGPEAGAGERRDVRILPYAPSDAPAVLRLAQIALLRPEEQVGAPLWENRAQLDAELGTWRVPPSRGLFVARCGATVVGVGGVDCDASSRVGLLHGPIVDPEHRGRGIGPDLLRMTLRAARWQGMGELWAGAGRENVRGQHMLTAEGFTRREVNVLYRLDQGDHRPLAEADRLTLRRAGPGDVEALALAHACRPNAQLPPTDLPAVLRDCDQMVFVGVENGTPIALIAFDTQDRWLYGLHVLPEPATRGMGAALLSAVLSTLWRDRPEERLGLTVRADDLAAIHLNRRQGFEPWLVLGRFVRPL